MVAQPVGGYRCLRDLLLHVYVPKAFHGCDLPRIRFVGLGSEDPAGFSSSDRLSDFETDRSESCFGSVSRQARDVAAGVDLGVSLGIALVCSRSPTVSYTRHFSEWAAAWDGLWSGARFP